MFCSCYFLSSKIKYISMQFSVEITMNLHDQVLILALNILKVSHLDGFFLPCLQADSSSTRSVHVKCSAGSTKMHNHKTSFIPKRCLALPCLGTWLLEQISTTERRLQSLNSFRIQQFCVLCSF